MKYLIVLALALLTGCATATKTLLVPQIVTNTPPPVVTTITNTVETIKTLYLTNTVTQKAEPVYLTNWSTIVTNTITQLPPVVVTNGYTVNPVASGVVQGAGSAVNLVAPGIGTLVGYAGAGALSLFAWFQNRKIGNQAGANQAMSKAIEQTQVALKSSPNPTLVKAGTLLMDVLGSHADNAPAGAKAVLQSLAESHGDTSAVIAMNQTARRATAEDLVAAAMSKIIPDWFDAAEKAAVAKIQS
jgi:hypothetical protein